VKSSILNKINQNRYLDVFVPLPNGEKWYFSKGPVIKVENYSKYSKFTFSTGTKSKKYHFSTFGTGTKTSRYRKKKIQKFFFEYFYRSKYLTFGPEHFLKNFEAALVSGTPFKKLFLN
jgi:hypothetical protein